MVGPLVLYVQSDSLRGQDHFVGYFRDEIDAARAYNRRASDVVGAFAKLNSV
jgi:hypothetical protein